MPVTHHEHLHSLIQLARPFLREEIESVDENLPALLTVLRSAGAGECWHRLGTFLDHLHHVYRILKLWKAPDSVCLFGLFHSVYSNSYHDLAIFDPVTGRETLRRHVGPTAERLIHIFCIVPRHPLIHDDLVFRYTDQELQEHLQASEISLRNIKEKGREEAWRKKLQTLVPATGIKSKHIRTGEPVVVSRRVVAVFLLMTMADFSDQYYGYQDALYDNHDGRLEFSGNSNFDILWPGNGKPGLWMNLVSRIASVYTLIMREEEIFMEERRRYGRDHTGVEAVDRDEDIELITPPVFDRCTKILDAGEQMVARDLYWEAVYDDGPMLKKEKGEEMLVECMEKNPFVGEPHVLLSQFYMSRGRFEEGGREAEMGLRLLLEWGCPWDKRVSWEGWVAWSRVLLNKAEEKSWPNTSWGIIGLGLVK